MINNFDKVSKHLKFESSDDFYFLQIIKRKKEHKELGRDSYVAKTYYISSLEDLEWFKSEIICLCEHHQARAYINLNRRSFRRVALENLRKNTEQIINETYKACRKSFNTCCGVHSKEPNKKWIIDIDFKGDSLDEVVVKIVSNTIKNCEPNRREDKIIDIFPTPSGVHLVTTAFNVEEFKKYHPEVDIKKDNPTILYSAI
jgi:hypothetical protein